MTEVAAPEHVQQDQVQHDQDRADHYAATRYPIVLIHGFMGFDSILGLQYFFQIPHLLREQGARVYVAQVNPSQTTEYRGEQLLAQLKQWAARDGVQKFNLIGHSHGGPTARYAAAVASDMVASVSSVGGAHYGSPIADQMAPNTAPDGAFHRSATMGLRLINWLAGGAPGTGKDTRLLTALGALSTAGSAIFNAKFPEGAHQGVGASGIRYFSVTGISVKTNAWDVSDAVLVHMASYFEPGQLTDGMVSQQSARWGEVLRDDYPWNHLDEINQIFGLVGKGAPDPKAFYLQHANRLKLLGL